MKRLTVVLALGLLVLTTGGCRKIKEKIAEKAAEKALEKATGGKVDIDTSGGGKVTFRDPKTGGTVQTGSGTKLPDDWPSDVPIYPGSTVFASASSPKQKYVHLQTKASPDAIVTFYKGKLPGKVMSEVNVGTGRSLALKDGERTIGVITAAADKGTSVQLTVAEK
jgi:hypothetical protein